MKEYHYIHSDMNALFYIRAHWELKRARWFQRCELSNQIIWPGSQAYQGTAVFLRDNDIKREIRWHKKKHHRAWLIKDL